MLITSLLNIFNIKSQYSLIFSSAGFVGILVAIIITFFGQNEAIKK
ncbi:hypothetical protein P20439_0152 [Pseudoalteromonas sp. BSi20439]|nr:hypothetical protein P20439_0152 [Pseudoalteromonas sp. BSi20439]